MMSGLISSGVCAASLHTAIKAVFDSWDADGSGNIDMSEFSTVLFSLGFRCSSRDGGREALAAQSPSAREFTPALPNNFGMLNISFPLPP